MLFLICQCGEDRFAIQGDRVMEVLPMVPVHALGGTGLAASGVIPYRGLSIPVVDLCLWRAGRPAVARLSTRIIVVSLPGDGGREFLTGLLAERATEMMRLEESAFGPVAHTGTTDDPATRVAWDARGLLRRLDLDRLAVHLRSDARLSPAGNLIAP